jgi:hypothetical protein
MGKGSRARPFEVDQKEFAKSWDRIFGKKDKEKAIKEEHNDKKTTEKDQIENDK